jgi:hypothetical protein
MVRCMGGAISARLIAFLIVGLILYGIARLIGVESTPQLTTVVAFLSAVVILIAEGVRRLLVKPPNPQNKS